MVVIQKINCMLWYMVCILSCVDTHLFVYPSLSRTLLPTLFAMVMAIIHIISCVRQRKCIKVNIIQTYIVIWLLYVGLHGTITENVETYLQIWLASTLLIPVIITSVIRSEQMNVRHVVNGILLIAIVHVTFELLQIVGMMSSVNPYFRVTGADENPNVTAIALTLSLPFVYERVSNKVHRNARLLLFVVMIFLIFYLRCRTAMIGCIVMFLIIGKHTNAYNRTKSILHESKCRILIVSLSILLSTILLAAGYMWKKDSADGRMFIWQRASEMIVSNPLGYGYGLYEKNYNRYQSDYFARHETERQQSKLRTACGSAYNDVLEHTVQGGIVGGVMYVCFILLLLVEALRLKKILLAGAISAVAVMALFNSIYCSASPWLITMTVAILIASDATPVRKKWLSHGVCLIFSMLIVGILYNRVSFVRSQILLNLLVKNNVYDIYALEKLQPYIGSSEAYWRSLADSYERQGNYKNAMTCYSNAMKYTSSPLVLYKTALCHEHCGDVSAATKLLRIGTMMLPANLSLKYHIMKMYHRNGNDTAARNVATEILMKWQGEDETDAMLFIRREATDILTQ